jgi:CheY-like chemotaxis protein
MFLRPPASIVTAVLQARKTPMVRASNGKVILCVDDEAAGLSVRKAVLESQGYRVLTAESGPEGLLLFSSETVHLVVLDYAMPEMHGGVVAERMKRLKPGIPIVLLSAYVDLPRDVLTLVDKSVTKGESPPVLLGAVAQLLNGA